MALTSARSLLLLWIGLAASATVFINIIDTIIDTTNIDTNIINTNIINIHIIDTNIIDTNIIDTLTLSLTPPSATLQI